MPEMSFQHQAETFGIAYEIFVKRGVLACLADRTLIDLEVQVLESWRKTTVSAVHKSVIHRLGILDETVKDQVRSMLDHLAHIAYGLGYTAMREYLKPLAKQLGFGLKTKAIWCPLELPGENRNFDVDTETLCMEFYERFSIDGYVDTIIAKKGMPARADFMLWLSGSGKEDYLLVLEFSYKMPSTISDYESEAAHLDELLRHRRLVDSKSVFASVSAEVEGESFQLSDIMISHLGAFTGEDKPFFKLCQASSYAVMMTDLLVGKKLIQKDCVVRALAITPHGLESLAARFVPGRTGNPRFTLMAKLGEAYRNAPKPRDGDEAALSAQVEAVFKRLMYELPPELKKGTKNLAQLPPAGEDYELEFQETTKDFANPAQKFTRLDALSMVGDLPALDQRLGGDAKAALMEAWDELSQGEDSLTLRDIHAGAVIAGIRSAKKGSLNAIACEGNPGIGKTSALTRYLNKKADGYLFLYVSPRVIINRDVSDKLARKNGQKTGVLTVTSNAQMNAAAERYHQLLVDEGRDTPRRIDGAVVVDGVEELREPRSSILILGPAEEEELTNAHAGTRFSKTTLSENEDLIEDRPLMGVLAAMATTTRELLTLNPGITRTNLTAAIQGFRLKKSGKTTIQALEKLFVQSGDRGRQSKAGRAEREAFAAKSPLILVMVDELTGDGAGAPFVHEIATWLREEFLDPFPPGKSPFTVILVVSDASLGNEIVFEKFLSAGDRVPDKVMISKSRGNRAFDLAETRLRLGSNLYNVLHIMTNSFPASSLTIKYRVSLADVRIMEKEPGVLETPRQAVKRAFETSRQSGVLTEIIRALNDGAPQIIYFAQDKLFLRDLCELLRGLDEHGLNRQNVHVIDSSVPAAQRKRLLEEHNRDRIRIFLMTSSGARGVSFPRTTVIITSVPRFSIEASLMEIAQLIYRGRGSYRDANGEVVSGDYLDRTLVMLINDFMVREEQLDRRQWLRQSVDLLTMLVMIRSTIFTRITGGAGLKQPFAIVPVGGIGVEEMTSTMSEVVGDFIKESDVFIRDGGNREVAGLVQAALSNCLEIFARFRINGTAKKGKNESSFVREREAMDFFERSTVSFSPLLQGDGCRASVPDHAYWCGPAIVESWADFDKIEGFGFEVQKLNVDSIAKMLVNQLIAIDRHAILPQSLRVAAKSLRRILDRDNWVFSEFRTMKRLMTDNAWTILPAGYCQFMSSVRKSLATGGKLMDPSLWKEGLGKEMGKGNVCMPIIALYQDIPWAMVLSQGKPMRLETVFDDRYFMASTEMNLLNALLLTNGENDGQRLN